MVLCRILSSCGVGSSLDISRETNIFHTFRRNHLRLSSSQFWDRNKIPVDDYGALVVGSDQIWYPGNNESGAYLLDFAKNVPRIAYAPSLGLDTIPDSFVDFYRNELQKFSALSVREKSGQELIKSLIGRDIPIVCDPTLLLDVEDYHPLETPRLFERPYVCVYAMRKHPWMLSVARRIAKKKGLSILWIQGEEMVQWRFRRGIYFRPCTGPCEFLSYLRHAEYVITNSFHGMAFSLIYQKQFLVCANATLANGTNSRMETLLSDFSRSLYPLYTK